ncbi:hypothetical protein GCM10009641_18610 [Mycobacterium cookii]|uniref:DUF7937 domain-containing protein n=1 Tax=Mycobacterium cookii TaxID=1775 RepID=A0A7I7L0J8_9MYCO|nr:hypothetical protein MCOO_36780 [Mycobacterium cookii]
MSQRHDDPATQNFATQRLSAGQGAPPPPRHPAPNEPSAKRWNIGRDVVAGVLLLIAPLFPWNLYFGIGIPHSSGALFALLAVVTVLSLAAVAVTYAIGSRPGNSLAGRLRVALSAPYILLVAGVVGFDVVQTIRYGGSGNVPGGVGPGAWLGISGALLSAQPSITGTATDDGSLRKWPMSARIVGYTSIALAALAVLFNLFWRTKAALPGSADSSGFGKQNMAIIATAVVYGVVALVPVVVAARWILQSSSRSSRLATIALGASTLTAGVVVWVLPVGREIDGFHGIAQNTSTAGVGFEGYLAWVAAAAIFAPLTLLRVATNQQIDRGIWRVAARKGLLLIAIWCLASALMRATDVIVAAVLHLSRSPYDSAAMATFDVLTAALAIWLRGNLLSRFFPVAVISSLCGVLLVLSVSRIVLGIALSPRIAGTPTGGGNPVYGNNLAQQITSTFDAVLSGLALCILVVAIITARFVQRRPPAKGKGDNQIRPVGSDAETTRLRIPGAAESTAPLRQQPTPPPRIHRPTEQPTRRIDVRSGREDATQQLSTRAPRIFRSDDRRQRPIAPPPQRPGQQSSTSAPKIHRPQPNPNERPGRGPTRDGGFPS